MCPLLLQIMVPQMSKSFLWKVLLNMCSVYHRPLYQARLMLRYSKLSCLIILTLPTRIWFKRVLLSCVLILLVVPFSWNYCLVLYQISYGLWSVGILVVGLLCYPRMLRTQAVHFSFPVLWHPTIMCPLFICLSQWLPWPYVGCSVGTCVSFANIFWPSWIWSCLFYWVLSLSNMQMLVHMWIGFVLCTLLFVPERTTWRP